MNRKGNLVAGAVVAVAGAVLAACGGGGSSGDATGGSAGQVTVYLGRHYGIEQVFNAFTAETGIAVRFTTGRDPELRERLKTEGKNTPADVYLAADAANLELAATDGLLAPLGSTVVTTAVPAVLRDSQDLWTALSVRARTVMRAARVPDAEAPRSYAALGDARWKGKLCLRPATHPYTQSLVAALIADGGVAGAERTVRGWVANNPTYLDSDTKILEALADGTCDVAVTNTYYLLRARSEGKDLAQAVWITEGQGTHVNVSGAGIATHSPNPAGAKRLIEWLATTGQRPFADANFEEPAAASVAPRAEVAALGTYRRDPIAVERFGALQPEAVKLLDRAGHR
ncbi:MAG: extracellular solute-binding protein [Acidimicrobiales bacterium]